MAITNDCSTSASEARMVGERSWAIFNWIDAGILSCSAGSSARMRSTVSMILASGARLMARIIAGLALVIPALRTSCTESLTSATSLRRTAEPLL
ncbi:hypothetical protein D3C78_1585960 [compost metagenome]